jgi:hypothetical protein
MSVGQMPMVRKCAIVVPIHKSGTASNPANYRPISLTSVFLQAHGACNKYRQIINYLRQHGLITQHQHGFLSKRSTVTNLLECINDWTLAIKNKQSTTVAYIDYSKVFNTVCCNKLLIKLISYGVKGRLLQWIQKFLTDRSQQVRVGAELSESGTFMSGWQFAWPFTFFALCK